MKTYPVAVDININETNATMKLRTEKQISDTSQIDRNMTTLTDTTYYEPNIIRLFRNQKGNRCYDHSPLKPRGTRVTRHPIICE